MKIKSVLKPKHVAWAMGALLGAIMVNLVAHSVAHVCPALDKTSCAGTLRQFHHFELLEI